jgi:hypothetical protein
MGYKHVALSGLVVESGRRIVFSKSDRYQLSRTTNTQLINNLKPQPSPERATCLLPIKGVLINYNPEGVACN